MSHSSEFIHAAEDGAIMPITHSSAVNSTTDTRARVDNPPLHPASAFPPFDVDVMQADALTTVEVNTVIVAQPAANLARTQQHLEHVNDLCDDIRNSMYADDRQTRRELDAGHNALRELGEIAALALVTDHPALGQPPVSVAATETVAPSGFSALIASFRETLDGDSPLGSAEDRVRLAQLLEICVRLERENWEARTQLAFIREFRPVETAHHATLARARELTAPVGDGGVARVTALPTATAAPAPVPPSPHALPALE